MRLADAHLGPMPAELALVDSGVAGRRLEDRQLGAEESGHSAPEDAIDVGWALGALYASAL